jgi:hypothetical protein
MTTIPAEKPPAPPAPSAFFPADNPAAIAHLNQVQAIISRLAGNSLQCKTWCLAIVGALFGLTGASKNPTIALIAIIPVVIFAFIDAAHLGNERAFRRLHERIAGLIQSGAYNRSNCFDLKPPDGENHYAFGSWSVWPIYLCLLVACLVLGLCKLIK